MTSHDVPFVIRGKVIRDFELCVPARFGAGVTFRTPDLARHLDGLMVRDPRALADLYALSLDQVLDYLETLGGCWTCAPIPTSGGISAGGRCRADDAADSETLFSSFSGMLSRTAMPKRSATSAATISRAGSART